MIFRTECSVNGIDAELQIEISRYQQATNEQQEEVEFDVFYYGRPFKGELSHHVLNFLEDKAKSFARRMK